MVELRTDIMTRILVSLYLGQANKLISWLASFSFVGDA